MSEPTPQPRRRDKSRSSAAHTTIATANLGIGRSTWSTIPACGSGDVYPGIDLVYYGSGSDLEYDFVVSPGADPNAIRLRFSAPARAMLRDDGALVLRTAAGAIVQRAPVVYQQASGRRVPVGGSYVQLGDNEFAFQVEGSPRGEKSGLKAGESIGVFYT